MHSTCKDTTTKAAFRYISPSTRPLTPEEAGIRSVAYAIKEHDCDPQIIDFAAEAMSKLIGKDERGYLIPVPNHRGDTTANHRLASTISVILAKRDRVVPFDVADMLTKDTNNNVSQCSRHRSRLAILRPEELAIRRRSGTETEIRLTGAERIYFVDNVITSGNTIEASRRVFFGLGTGLVFADAHYDMKN